MPLASLWEALTPIKCWASSRYEYAYRWAFYYWLPVLKR